VTAGARSLRALVAVICAGCFAPAFAHAARIPTRAESTALNKLLSARVAMDGGCPTRLSDPVPLVAAGARWARISVYCASPDGTAPGIRMWSIWARRASATSRAWRASGLDTRSTRVAECASLFAVVPRSVVTDLRGSCVRPNSEYRPVPQLSLTIFRNLSGEFDSIGPSLSLDSLSNVNGGALGLFSIDRDGPPYASGPTVTVGSVREAFGKPSSAVAARGQCRARWPRVRLAVIAKLGPGSGCFSPDTRVIRMVLGAGWQLAQADEADGGFARSLAPSARVGDRVDVARYLDPRLGGLRPGMSIGLDPVAISTTTVTPMVRVVGDRIGRIELLLDQAG
jgi:hypothetical protein